MSTTIIGLIGPKRSGKTTAFNTLKSIHGAVVEVQLAKKLKDTCSLVFKVERNHFDDQNFKEVPFKIPLAVTNNHIKAICDQYNIGTEGLLDEEDTFTVIKTPRQLLQYIGTDVLRKNDPYIHCKSIEIPKDSSDIYVITDVRFQNEHNYFMSNQNFYPVYIQRDEAEKELDGHPSEQESKFLKEVSYILENNGTIEDLELKIKDYLTLLS